MAEELRETELEVLRRLEKDYREEIERVYFNQSRCRVLKREVAILRDKLRKAGHNV